jgi:CBS domain-containing protein
MLPGLFQKTPLTVDDTTPITHVGMLMAIKEIDFLPVYFYEMDQQGHIMHRIGRIAGYIVTKALHDVRGPELLDKTVKDFVNTKIELIPQMSLLTDLLDAIVKTQFGHACIGEHNEIAATVSLRDLIRYAPSIGLDGDMQVKEVASDLISLPQDATMNQLLNMLLEKRIRRVLVDGLEQPRMVDDRVIARHAFSYEGLRVRRTSSQKFYDRPLYSLPVLKPGRINPDASLAEAWSLIYENPAECLLVEGENKIITPWDVVIKPYLRHKASGQTASEPSGIAL